MPLPVGIRPRVRTPIGGCTGRSRRDFASFWPREESNLRTRIRSRPNRRDGRRLRETLPRSARETRPLRGFPVSGLFRLSRHSSLTPSAGSNESRNVGSGRSSGGERTVCHRRPEEAAAGRGKTRSSSRTRPRPACPSATCAQSSVPNQRGGWRGESAEPTRFADHPSPLYTARRPRAPERPGGRREGSDRGGRRERKQGQAVGPTRRRRRVASARGRD